MRRFRQQLPESEVRQLLTAATNGVLSLVDPGGAPYGVPMSFVYDGAQTLWFHCAREGRKMACLRAGNRASFCVVGQDEVHPEEFTTYYRSAIVAGRLCVVEERDEVVAALRLLCEKYAPGRDSAPEIARNLERVTLLRLDIETMSGKEAIELTRRRCNP